MIAQTSGATSAPPILLDALRRSRVLARASLSPAVAGVVAGLAFGADRRDHDKLLWALTADRTAAAGTVRS